MMKGQQRKYIIQRPVNEEDIHRIKTPEDEGYIGAMEHAEKLIN